MSPQSLFEEILRRKLVKFLLSYKLVFSSKEIIILLTSGYVEHLSYLCVLYCFLNNGFSSTIDVIQDMIINSVRKIL